MNTEERSKAQTSRAGRQNTRRVGALQDPVDLRGLFTSASECTRAVVGDVPHAALQVMKDRQYDQAPVVTSEGSAIGIVSLPALQTLGANCEPLSAGLPAIRPSRVQCPLPLERLLEVFCTERAALVYEQEEWIGLITLADLNRHVVRGLLYLALARFEERLAILIQDTYDDPWDWLKSLTDWDKIVLVGNWEVTRRNSVDLGPIHAASMTQLVKVVVKDPMLFGQCGFSSRNKAEDALGKVPDVRNSVMHPVRPLAMSSEDVARVLAALRAMEDVLQTLSSQRPS